MTKTEEQPGEPDVGSLAEEALRLFGALGSWASREGADLGDGVSELAGRAGQAWQEVNEHVATGAAECLFCPICRFVSAMRELSPELSEQFGALAAGLLHLASRLGQGAQPSRPRDAKIQHIDLDEEDPEDPAE